MEVLLPNFKYVTKYVRKYFLIGILFLTGCTTTKQAVKTADWSKPVADKATIRFTRESQALAAAANLWIYDGEKEIGSLGGGGCLCWEHPPGGILIKVVNKWAPSPYMFYIPDTVAGGRYEFHVHYSKWGACIEEVETIPD